MPITIGSAGITIPSGSNPDIDLATYDYVVNLLKAGGTTPSSAQLAVVPSLITAASREISRFCGRLFPAQTYAEILAPEGYGRQDRGEVASARVKQFPITAVASVRVGRCPVLTIQNTDTTTNQFASVAFTFSGDVEWPETLVYTGLLLSRDASGTTVPNTLTFAAYPTVGALATAIKALGGGWTATVGSTTNGVNPALIATAQLVGVREPKEALGTGTGNGACLSAFLQTATRYDLNRANGILRDFGGCGYGFGWGAWGDGWDMEGDGAAGDGGAYGWRQFRVVYTAGFATIPEQLQRVTAEAVKLTLDRIKTDGTYKSISGGNEAEHWSKTVRDSWSSLPDWCMQTLWALKGNYI